MKFTGLWTDVRADEMHVLEATEGGKSEIFAMRLSGPPAPMTFTVNRDLGRGEGAL